MEPLAYFVSDIHLKEKDEVNAQVFIRFLRNLREEGKVTHLFLVGDIFDLWVGPHGYFIEKFHPVVEEIDRLVQKRVEVHYFEGNHDLHLQKYWEDKLGVKVHCEPQMFDIAGIRIRVEHGDLIDPEDRGYRFLKWTLNTPAMKILAHKMPERIVSLIGENASQASRHYTTYTKTITAQDVIQKIRQHAYRVVPKDPFDLMVTGHLHIRDDYTFRHGDREVRSVNLGTWLAEPCAFTVSEKKQEFIKLV